MQAAWRSDTRLDTIAPIVRMLILRGVPVRPQDLSSERRRHNRYHNSDLHRLAASLETDIKLKYQIFIGIFLAGGVHAPNTEPIPPFENQLPKLRGFSELLMEIRDLLGVRSEVELGRLRAARDVLVALG